MDLRNVLIRIHGALRDAHPSRRHLDLADIARPLASAELDLARVREYFRLFDREKELDALLAERAR